MSNVLVAYATAAGSTQEVAEAIGEALRATGLTVDVRAAGKVSDLARYDATVVGSGIRAHRPYAPAQKFVKAHEQVLARMPLACFVVCGAAGEGTPEEDQRAEGYARLLTADTALSPVSVGLFGGCIDMEKLPKLMGWTLKLIGKGTSGDTRDWDAIRAWATELGEKLKAG